jgi:hypothetical protein
MSFLNLVQWADLNPAAAFDFWMRDSMALVNGGQWVKFMLPPRTGYIGMPVPLLRRGTMYARPDAIGKIGMTGSYTPPIDRPGGFAFDLSAQGANRTLLATMEVNVWCGRLMFDRLGNPIAVEQSHLAALSYLRQFRDACINSGDNVIFTTDQALHQETYYIHQYVEDIMPWAYPDRDWVVQLHMVGVGGVGLG